MVDSGQKLQVAVVHSNGRRGFDPLSKERLLAACLEPGASVSRLALENGVNVNLVWKWLRKYRATKKEAFPITPFPPAFIPVQIEGEAERRVSKRTIVPDLAVPRGEELRAKPEAGLISSPAKVSVSLPNGVKLTLECSDVDALAAIIGTLGHVQTGR